MKKISSIIKEIGTRIKSFFSNIKTKIKAWSEKIRSNFKNKNVKNNDIQASTYTQKDKTNQVERDTKSSFIPTENLNIYKPVSKTTDINNSDNNIQEPIPVEEQKEIQDDNNGQENFTAERIQRIEIKEETGEAQYTTVEGKVYTVDINKVLDNKKGIYKDFRISKKCKEITSSFFKGKKLEKSLNPLVIDGLNNEEDIDKYIKCVNNEENLFFDLQHSTQNSTLGFFNKNRMKHIAEVEKKLGADVQMDLGFFDKLKINTKELFDKEKRQKGREEKMIANQYKQALKMLQKKSINTLYESKKYAKIESTLEKCAEWYINNGNFKNADNCLGVLSDMMDDKHRNYYLPKYNEEEKKGNKEYAIEHFAQEESIKRNRLEKLIIKKEYLSGNKDVAKQRYIQMLQDFGIELTQEEFEASIKYDGLINGTYSKLVTKMEQNPDGSYSMNNVFENIQIIGNERVLEVLKELKSMKQNTIVTNAENKEETREEEQTDTTGQEEIEQNLPINNTKMAESVIEQETKKTEPKQIDQETRKEIVKLINRSNKLTTEKKYKQGGVVVLINKMINYLQDNNDIELQNRLNLELENSKDFLDTQGSLGSNIGVWDYFHDLYKDGFKSNDGRTIIEKDKKKYSYYLYIANKLLNDRYTDGEMPKGWSTNEERIKKLREEYNTNKEEVEYLYIKYIKEKRDSRNKTSIDNLIAEAKFFEEISKNKILKSNSDYLNLAIAYENIVRVNNKKNKDTTDKIIKSIEDKMKNGEEVGTRALELLGNIYYEGIKNNDSGDIIIPQNKIQASKVYSYVINNNKNNPSEEMYRRLFELYSDNRLPIYDIKKAKQLENIMKQKGITTEIKNTKKCEESAQPYTYVCSDIHSEYAVYQAIINQLKEGDKLYILGDVIDRGPDGIKILQDVMKRHEKGQVEFIIGNHEHMMIQSLFFNNQTVKKTWEENGGAITEKLYYSLPTEQQEKIKQFLLNALAYKEIKVKGENIYLVHAKASNDLSKKEETVREIMDSGRERILREILNYRASWGDCTEAEVQKRGIFTIVGHSPRLYTKCIEYNNYGSMYIDCGATYDGGREALIRLEDGKVLYFDSETEREKLKEQEVSKV